MATYLNVSLFLALFVCISIRGVASQTASYGWQQNRFGITRAANGTELCSVDPPSTVFNVSQLNVGPLVSIGCVPLKALCAWKCTNDPDCISYNWRDDMELCDVFYYPPTRCAIVNYCIFYQSSDNFGLCATEIGLHPGRYLLQQNINGSDLFSGRTWKEYADGFGDPTDNYWMGNERFYQLTNVVSNCSLELDMLCNNGLWYTSIYASVSVSDEAGGYRLHVAGSYGNASDGLGNQNGKMFSTIDRDNDVTSTQDCANLLGVGWWYGGTSNAVDNSIKCGSTNLNCNSTYFLHYGANIKHLLRSAMWLNCVG